MKSVFFDAESMHFEAFCHASAFLTEWLAICYESERKTGIEPATLSLGS